MNTNKLLLIVFSVMLILAGGLSFMYFSEVSDFTLSIPGINRQNDIEFIDETKVSEKYQIEEEKLEASYEEMGIWDEGVWDLSEDVRTYESRQFVPGTVKIVLTEREQKYFKISDQNKSDDTKVLSSIGQELKGDELTILLFVDGDYLEELLTNSDDNLARETLTYFALYAAYKMSNKPQAIESPDYTMQENAQKSIDFIQGLIKKYGYVFSLKDSSYRKMIDAFAYIFDGIVSEVNAQCSGLIICGTRTPTSVICSSTGTRADCTLMRCGQTCTNGGRCVCTYTCDIGDDVNIYCPFRTTQTQCINAACGGVYDCTDPWNDSRCSWASSPPPPGETPPPPPPAIPSCTATSDFGDSEPIQEGEEKNMTVSVNYSGGTVSYVRFISSDTSAIYFVPHPYDDNHAPYRATLSAVGVAGDTSTVRARVYMNGAFRCETESLVTVTAPPASCTVTSNFGATEEANMGTVLDLEAYPNPTAGTVESVRFTSSDNSIIEISPNPTNDTSATYEVSPRVVGTPGQSATVTMDVYMAGAVRCTTQTQVTVLPPDPWWQVSDSDIWSSGKIASNVLFTDYFDEDGAGGYPGVPVYGSTFDIDDSLISTKSWKAHSSNLYTILPDKRLLYDYFRGTVIPDYEGLVVGIGIPSTTGAMFASGYDAYIDPKGYLVFETQYPGNFEITQPVIIPAGRKVVLFVDEGNLTIRGNITIIDPGSSSFTVVSSGNIQIAPTVTSLDGQYITNGTFTTGSIGADSDQPLTVRGNLVAWNGVDLQRDVPEAQNVNPTEKFEYSAAMYLNTPYFFSPIQKKWREVAP